jgi:hypothetical protein
LVGANEELQEDCLDIWKGVYSELMGIKGVMGEKGEMGFNITKLKFYPLDRSLPPIVQIYLRCKEMGLLFYKLQNSLADKMKADNTMSKDNKFRLNEEERERHNEWLEAELARQGLVRLENGRYVSKEKYERMKKWIKGRKGIKGNKGIIF